MPNDDLLKLLILLAQFAERYPDLNLETIADAYQVVQEELIYNQGMTAVEIYNIVDGQVGHGVAGWLNGHE